MDRKPICEDVNIPDIAICNYSEYAKYAIENRKGGHWCGIACCGEYRIYKVNDGERHWVWAKSKKQIKDYWKAEYDVDEDEFEDIDAVNYHDASNTIITCEDDTKKSLLDIFFTDYKDKKELEIIASSLW